MDTLFVLYFYIDLTVNVLIVRMATISIHFVHPAIHFQRSRPFFSRFIFENCKARNLAWEKNCRGNFFFQCKFFWRTFPEVVSAMQFFFQTRFRSLHLQSRTVQSRFGTQVKFELKEMTSNILKNVVKITANENILLMESDITSLYP